MGKRNRNGKNKGRFAGIPIWILESSADVALSPLAKALLIEIAGQYSGRGNGYLSLTRGNLKLRGFTTPASNQKAIESLLEAKLLTRTIDGGICRGQRACHLYSINWQPSDERIDRPFDSQPPTMQALKDALEVTKIKLV